MTGSGLEHIYRIVSIFGSASAFLIQAYVANVICAQASSTLASSNYRAMHLNC